VPGAFLGAAVVVLLSFAAEQPALPKRSLVQFAATGTDDTRLLQDMGADVLDVSAGTVRCLVTAEQLVRIESSGFPAIVELDDFAAHDPCAEPGDFGFYHTYAQLRDSLAALALRHPDICRLETLGYSVQNRLLLGLRISDNIAVREDEPRLRLDGNIHGSEKLGCEVALHVAYALADSYDLAPRITALVNNTEILCVPMVNPDGAYANQRYNANGVDLNRDFGYMWDAWGQSPDWFSQPETRALRLDCERNRYVMSISFHTGAKLVVYPWMYTPVSTPDDLLFKRLVYAYRSATGYDTMQSHRWYQTHGQSFDCRYGLEGTLEITTELHESNPPADSIDHYCRLNREAVLYFLEKSLTGVHGTIADAATGEPVSALIRISPASGGRDWFVYSSAENGDFHRPLLAGSYSLAVTANGYRDTVVTPVVVPDTLSPVTVHVALEPGATAAASALVCVQQNDSTGLVNTSLTHWLLGNPDQRAYSMSFRGRLVLDIGASSEVTNGPGPDMCVVEHPDTTDTIFVYAGRAWNGPWTYLGRGVGTCSLDLEGLGIDTVRYFRLNDANRRPNSGPSAGFDIDAVVALNHLVGVMLPDEACSLPQRATTIVRGTLSLRTTMSDSRSGAALLDAAGRKVMELVPGRNDVSGLESGVYFVRIARTARKVLLVR